MKLKPSIKIRKDASPSIENDNSTLILNNPNLSNN